METRSFGPGGPELPALGYGAMSLGNAWGPVDDAGSERMLAALVDHGIVHVDTANIYGQGLSETRIGAFLKARGSNPFHIATKATITRDADGNRRFDNSGDHLMSELDGSLTRLGVEQVDLFYAHRREPGHPPEYLAESLGRILESGKAKAVGLSEVAPTTLLAINEITPISAVQSEYSLQSRNPDLGLIRACERLGIAFVAFSPVGRGLLTDAPPAADAVAKNFFWKDNPRFQPGTLDRNIARLAMLRAYAADLGLTLAGLATAWTIRRGSTVFPIPGTRSVAHLADLVAGAERSLSEAEMAEIDQICPPGWCEGDRYGVNQWYGPESYC